MYGLYFSFTIKDAFIIVFTIEQSPTLGAHTDAHGCDIIVHGWAWVGIGLVHPCIQLQIGVKFSYAGNTLTKKRFGLKRAIVNNLLFVRSNQDLV